MSKVKQKSMQDLIEEIKKASKSLAEDYNVIDISVVISENLMEEKIISVSLKI